MWRLLLDGFPKNVHRTISAAKPTLVVLRTAFRGKATSSPRTCLFRSISTSSALLSKFSGKKPHNLARGATDSLLAVQAILSNVELGSNSLPSKTLASGSATVNRTKALGTADIVGKTLEEKVLKTTPGDSSSEPIASVSMAPTFATNYAALRYLQLHAMRCLSNLPYSVQRHHLSRAYLIDLVSKMISHSMIKDAKLLVEAMDQSLHFQPPPYLKEYFGKHHEGLDVEKIGEALKEHELKHGSVPDAAFLTAIRPFFEIQDWKSCERLFSSISKHSTVISNLHLQTLILDNSIFKAKTLFQQMLDENIQTRGKFGADSNSFSLMMNYFASNNDRKQVDVLLKTLINMRAAPVKATHFEIFLACFTNAEEWNGIVHMMTHMVSLKVYNISAEAATQALWAHIHTGKTSKAIQFATVLDHPSLSSSLPYLKALLNCYSILASQSARAYSTEIKNLQLKIKALEPSSTATSDKSPLAIPKSMPREHPLATADPALLDKFVQELVAGNPLDLNQAQALVTGHHWAPHILLKYFKSIIDLKGSEIPIELCTTVCKNLGDSKNLSTAILWIDEARIPSHVDILTQKLRSYLLMAQLPLHTNSKPEKLYNRTKHTVETFTAVHPEPLPWDTLKYYTRVLYQVQKGRDAILLVETRLPTQQEMFNAPAQAFLPNYTPSSAKKSLRSNPKQKAQLSSEEAVILALKQKVQIPAWVAIDFYNWCFLADLTGLDKNTMKREREAVTKFEEDSVLPASHLQALLGFIQLVIRLPTVTRTAKLGWKSRYINNSL